MIYLKSVMLAVLEGFTEFLPISSTGHMILLEHWMQLSDDRAFTNAFIVIIQFPAILAVLLYFWPDLWPLRQDPHERRVRVQLWMKILVASIPAALIGLSAKDFIEGRLFNGVVVALALVIGGILLLALDRDMPARQVATARDIPFRTAFWIGVIQCLGMIPGTSRSAATIIGAMVLGASRTAAAEFSFFLAIPTMFGASLLVAAEKGLDFSRQEYTVLLTGSVVSFLVAYAVIAGFMAWIRRYSFRLFGYYRIALGAIVLAWFICRRMAG